MPDRRLKLLFIINPVSGNSKTDWSQAITDYFNSHPYDIETFELPNPCDISKISAVIKKAGADKVIAVGGDGTVKMVAECLLKSDTPLGILPAGSANGMAREFAIPDDPVAALDVIVKGELKKIHLVRVNKELCIHLSDVGFNAFVVKKFEEENTRGMWGYVKAAWKVLWKHSRMNVEIMIDDEYIRREAAMVVIANASKYGNGVVINPEGSLEDKLFEVVIIRRISLSEIFKMRFTHKDFNEKKTELLQSSSLKIRSRHHLHFQVDGEYMGRVKEVKAEIIPAALNVIVPMIDRNDGEKTEK
jgi:YegS/Rv2252/BmrU family lipid kinase